MVNEVDQIIGVLLPGAWCLVIDTLCDMVVELLTELIPRLRWRALALFELDRMFQDRSVTCLHLGGSSSWQVEGMPTLDEKADDQEEGK